MFTCYVSLTCCAQVKIVCFPILRRKKNLLHKLIEGLAPSSAPSVFSPEKGVLKDFAKPTGKL